MAVAAAAVNNFRTIPVVVGVATTSVYEAPVGFVGVVLLAQCANVSSTTQKITWSHNRIGSTGTVVTTEIVKDFELPRNDTINLLPGKLVLETGDYVTINSSTAVSSELKFILSILETSNQ